MTDDIIIRVRGTGRRHLGFINNDKERETLVRTKAWDSRKTCSCCMRQQQQHPVGLRDPNEERFDPRYRKKREVVVVASHTRVGQGYENISNPATDLNYLKTLSI